MSLVIGENKLTQSAENNTASRRLWKTADAASNAGNRLPVLVNNHSGDVGLRAAGLCKLRAHRGTKEKAYSHRFHTLMTFELWIS
jgi:hypothetical protein